MFRDYCSQLVVSAYLAPHMNEEDSISTAPAAAAAAVVVVVHLEIYCTDCYPLFRPNWAAVAAAAHL